MYRSRTILAITIDRNPPRSSLPVQLGNAESLYQAKDGRSAATCARDMKSSLSSSISVLVFVCQQMVQSNLHLYCSQCGQSWLHSAFPRITASFASSFLCATITALTLPRHAPARSDQKSFCERLATSRPTLYS